MRIILILLTLAGLNFATLAPAQAETPWSHWSQCPFAQNPEDAISRVEAALHDMSMPDEVKHQFVALVSADHNGSAATVRPGDYFEEMQSCGGHLITGGIRVADYIDPAGVEHRGHTMGAREWHKDYQGRRYVLTLPDPCDNWAWRSEAIPAPAPERVVSAPPEEDCAVATAPDVQQNDALHNAIIGAGPLPTESRCWGISVDNVHWSPWPTNCDRCAMSAFEQLARGMPIRQAGRFRMTAPGPLYVRVPRAVAEHFMLAICIERGDRSALVGAAPHAWHGTTSMTFPEWRWTEAAARERPN